MSRAHPEALMRCCGGSHRFERSGGHVRRRCVRCQMVRTLYPLWRLEETNPVLAAIAWANPFSHAVELIRFALYLEAEPLALAVCALAFLAFFVLAVLGYDPGRGFWARRAPE